MRRLFRAAGLCCWRSTVIHSFSSDVLWFSSQGREAADGAGAPDVGAERVPVLRGCELQETSVQSGRGAPALYPLCVEPEETQFLAEGGDGGIL